MNPKRKFRLAEILAREATDTSQSPFQGISRLVQAFLAKRAFDSATRQKRPSYLGESRVLH